MAAKLTSSPPKGRIRPVCGLGIDVHQDFYVVVEQEGGSNPKPPQRFQKQAFLQWAAKLKKKGEQMHAVYEACGFGFGLQRALTGLGIQCHVVCPQKLDERNKRMKTDGLDASAVAATQGSPFCPLVFIRVRLITQITIDVGAG